MDTPDDAMQSDTDAGQREVPAKRRKVRKGTRSCWECKRRKIRCIFASSQDVTCIGCQRRRSPCVSQDMPEDLSPATKDNRRLGERIARVENLMKGIVSSNQDPITPASSNVEGGIQDGSSVAPEVLKQTPNTASTSPSRAPLEFVSGSLEESARSSSLLTPVSQAASSGLSESEKANLGHLIAAFPSADDTKVLLKACSRPWRYTYLVNTQPHSRLTYASLAAPYSVPELPGPNTHPVVLAKLMLIFAITLQNPGGEDFPGLAEPQGTLMTRLVTAATTWVTTKEEMQGTLESLVCILLEGVFELNTGNLRRAWVVFRRAMALAQLMGLHRSPMPPIKRLNPDLDASPDYMWFRIVYLDRYLSLLLGLPQGTTDKNIGAVLQNEPPLGKFEQQLSIIASDILDRNNTNASTSEDTVTQIIDAKLLGVPNIMPASFWRPPNFHNLQRGSPDALLQTVNLSAQVYYYSLLIQVHLPHITATGHEYSKITSANASREIISRFIAHRTFNPMSSCSRPVDFFALLAAITLLLIHLNAHQEATNCFAHQRLTDRAMLDQALETMEILSSMNNDVISNESAKLIRQLIDFEADAAKGGRYTAYHMGEANGDSNETTNEGDKGLRLHLPYLGYINIARQYPNSREPPLGPAGSRLNLPHAQYPRGGEALASPISNNNVFATPTHSSPASQQQTIGYAMSQGSVYTGNRPMSQHAESTPLQEPLPGYEQYISQYPMASYDSTALGLPPITADINNWAFQGVDVAFFDSLIRGPYSVDAADAEQQ